MAFEVAQLAATESLGRPAPFDAAAVEYQVRPASKSEPTMPDYDQLCLQRAVPSALP
jgi:hypothetical protein